LRKVKWGVIGVAKIATEKVIPAMQRGKVSEIAAIASRDPSKARTAAEKLGIPRSYGSYEELLADPEIEAIYNPLPNEGHVRWTLKALEAGKHVLCEKPIALNVEEARPLIDARNRSGKLVAEAFMVRFHPQWRRARELARDGTIGETQAIQTFFSYRLLDPDNAATPSLPRATFSARSRPGSWPRSTGTRSLKPTVWRALFSSSPADATLLSASARNCRRTSG
jgi:predicted dehydrogenase